VALSGDRNLSQGEKVLWRQEAGGWAAISAEGIPEWVGQGEDDSCFIKTRSSLVKLEPKTGKVFWRRASSGIVGCLLRGSDLLDPWVQVEYSPDYQHKTTTMRLLTCDLTTGTARSALNIRRFEGDYDDLFVGTALEGDSLRLELHFVVHD
jgi:hypothetical protein